MVNKRQVEAFKIMYYDFEKEKIFCFNYIAEDNFVKQIWLRHYWGDQTYIRTTGSTNSGKTMINNWFYWLCVHGIYKYEPDLIDFHFGVKDLASKISHIKGRCVRNNEAGSRGKHWNSDDNTWWSKILQQQRSQRNIYLEDLPHTKEVSGISNLHCNFLLIIERYVALSFSKEQDIDIKKINIKQIEDYEMKRRARIYKYEVDYLGVSAESKAFNYAIPLSFDLAWIPDFEKDKRWEHFVKWHNEVYMPYEKICKQKLGESIENEVKDKEAKEIIKKKKIRKITENTSINEFI